MFYGRLKNAAGDIFSKDNVARDGLPSDTGPRDLRRGVRSATRSLLYKPFEDARTRTHTRTRPEYVVIRGCPLNSLGRA